MLYVKFLSDELMHHKSSQNISDILLRADIGLKVCGIVFQLHARATNVYIYPKYWGPTSNPFSVYRVPFSSKGKMAGELYFKDDTIVLNFKT